MQMVNLDETSIRSLMDLPETGMGFQLVEASVWGDVKPFLVFNSERAIDLSEIAMEPGDDPSVVLRNGLKIIELMKDDIVRTMFMAPQPNSFRLLASRVPADRRTAVAAIAVKATLPSSLVKHVPGLLAPRTFHRFSAFNPDRRVDPSTGSFLPGTYACPESEVPFVPTGFIAVGRFALPNSLPASHHFAIEAPAGTTVDFGTVAPAFGQAGGGVEAFFAGPVKNAAVPPVPPRRLPDE